jgi:hypothetical protein
MVAPGTMKNEFDSKDNAQPKLIPHQGVSWNTTPEELRRGLPIPPERIDFSSEDDYEDAKLSWARAVMPALQRRISLSH